MNLGSASVLFSNRSLGLAFWIEGPAIMIMVWLATYGATLILKNNGYTPTSEALLHVSLQFIGILLVTTYIWLVSNNAKRKIWAHLAKLVYIAHCIAYAALIITLASGANA